MANNEYSKGSETITFASIVADAIKRREKQVAQSASKDRRNGQLQGLRTAKAVTYARIRSASSLAGVEELLDFSPCREKHEGEIRDWLTGLVGHGPVEIRSTDETLNFSVKDLSAMTVAASRRNIRSAIAIALALGDAPGRDKLAVAAAGYLRRADGRDTLHSSKVIEEKPEADCFDDE